jgi:hypothetical protein
MKTALRTGIYLLPLLALASGCGGQNRPVQDNIDVSGSILPGSDMVCVINAKAIRQSEMLKQHDNDSEASSKSPSELAKKERLQKATGLSDSNILSIVVSTDIDSWALYSGSAGAGGITNITGVAVVNLSTNLTISRLSDGIKIMLEERKDRSLSECTIDGNKTLLVSQSGTNGMPAYIGLSPDGRSLYMSLNEKSMALALAGRRNASDAHADAIISAENKIPRQSQVRIAMAINEETRTRIREQVGKLSGIRTNDARSAMIASFIKPLENIRSLMLNATMTTNLQANIACDLGNEENAMQVTAMLQNMLIPTLALALSGAEGKAFVGLAQRLEITNNGALVNLGFFMSADDLSALTSQTTASGLGTLPGKTPSSKQQNPPPR